MTGGGVKISKGPRHSEIPSPTPLTPELENVRLFADIRSFPMKTLIDSHFSGKFKNDYAPNGVSDLKCFHMEGELYCGLSHSYFLMIFISAALNIPVSIISVFLFLF